MSHKIIPLFALSLLLTIASAYDATLVKTLFYLDETNSFTQPFFQTKNNIIGYNVENSVPHFYTINLQNSSASLFFEDTMTACGQNNATYLRMSYHSNTSTLVYYCTLNNTLLILDEDNYSVKSTVPVSTTGVFKETKIYAEGTSVVILGIPTSYLPNSTPTQLIKIDLETMQVVRQITFDTGLADGEMVSAYTSGNLLSFVLTTHVNLETRTVTSTIYSVIFAGSPYKLVKITAFDYSNKYTFDYNPSELATYGPYLVANDDKDILFYTVAGQLHHTYNMLKFVFQDSENPETRLNIPLYAIQHGSSTFYAQLTTEYFVKFSLSGTSLNEDLIFKTYELNFVLGNQYNGDLLFTSSDTGFNIVDPKTAKAIYSTQNKLGESIGIALTNSNYIVYEYDSSLEFPVMVYDLKTNLKIGDLRSSSNPLGAYYDQINNVYYFIEGDTYQCQVKYFDAKSLETGDVFSFDIEPHYTTSICMNTRIKNVELTDKEHSPNMVIFVTDTYSPDGMEYIIYTQTHDRIIVNWPYGVSTYVFADYDNMTIYYLMTDFDKNFTVNTYIYDENINNFTIKDTYNITNVPNTDTQASLQINSSTIAFISDTKCGLVNLADRTSTFYEVPKYRNSDISSVKDVQGQAHLIISDMGWNGVGPRMFDLDGTVSKMPESNKYTEKAASAGPSSFFLFDDLRGVQVVRFYDSLSSNPNDDSRQREIAYDYMIEDIMDIIQ